MAHKRLDSQNRVVSPAELLAHLPEILNNGPYTRLSELLHQREERFAIDNGGRCLDDTDLRRFFHHSSERDDGLAGHETIGVYNSPFRYKGKAIRNPANPRSTGIFFDDLVPTGAEDSAEVDLAYFISLDNIDAHRIVVIQTEMNKLHLKVAASATRSVSCQNECRDIRHTIRSSETRESAAAREMIPPRASWLDPRRCQNQTVPWRVETSRGL